MDGTDRIQLQISHIKSGWNIMIYLNNSMAFQSRWILLGFPHHLGWGLKLYLSLKIIQGIPSSDKVESVARK